MSISKEFCSVVKTHFTSNFQKDLQILALRSQLAVLQELLQDQNIKPRVTNQFRRLWVFLSKTLPNWREMLVLVKPETVVG